VLAGLPVLELDPAELQIDLHLKVAVHLFLVLEGHLHRQPPLVRVSTLVAQTIQSILVMWYDIPPRISNRLLLLLFVVVDFSTSSYSVSPTTIIIIIIIIIIKMTRTFTTRL
jgi:hypothetical protein